MHLAQRLPFLLLNTCKLADSTQLQIISSNKYEKPSIAKDFLKCIAMVMRNVWLWISGYTSAKVL